MDSNPTPFAKAVEDFIVDTSHKADKCSDFYQQVLAEVNSGTIRRDSAEESKRCAQHLATFIETLQSKHQRNKTVRRVSDRLQPLISGLSQYTGVCDVLIQAGPMGAVLIYGGARLVLQLAQNFSGLFDTVIGILEDVGHDLQCYGLFSTAYKWSTEVQELLVQSYKRIILLWQDISKLLASKTYKLLFRNVAQPMATKWQMCKDALRRDRERVSMLSQAVEADLRRQKDEEAKRDSAALRQIEQIKQVAAWIKSRCFDQDLDHQHMAQSYASKRYSFTCEWLLKHPFYETWLSSKTGAVILTGPPGVGKTTWASTIIQDLESRALNTACFFFSFSDPKQSDPMTALRSLALSLFRFYDYVPERVQELHNHDLKNRYVELHVLDTAIEVVRALVKKIDRVHIVLDGLDECIGPELSKLCTILDRLLMPEPYGGITKWLFTSLPRPEILECMKKRDVQIIEAAQESLTGDVRLYTTHIMETRLERNCSHCIEDLVSKSEGNFQWISHTLRLMELEGLTCDEDIDEALSKTHRGLTNCYKRNLHHLKTRSKSQRELAGKIFAILAGTAQPLRLREMSQALAIIGSSKTIANDYNPRRVPPSAIVKELCSGFVSFDERKSSKDDPYLKFAHKSIQDFFIDNPHDLDLSTPDELFFTSFASAKEQLGLACVRYLSFKRYDSPSNVQELVQEPDHAFLKHAATFWHSYLNQAVPSAELFDAIQKFISGPSFWNCIAVQSYIAPHLFGCYVQRPERDFSLESVRPSNVVQRDLNYGVPLPSWLDDYSAQSERLSKQLYTLAKQWHPILNSHHTAIHQCIMSSVWDDRDPDRTFWKAERFTGYYLHHGRTTDTKAQEAFRWDQIASIESLSMGKLNVTTRKRRFSMDAMEIRSTQWHIDHEIVTMDQDLVSRFTKHRTEPAITLALLVGSGYTLYDMSSHSGDFKIETELGTVELDSNHGSQRFRPLRNAEESWGIINHTRMKPRHYSQQSSEIEIIYGISGSTKDSIKTESDPETSDSESDHTSVYSNDDSETTGDKSTENATSDAIPNRFILVICPGKAHIWSTWTSRSSLDTTHAAIHPEGHMIIWSPSPYEARIAYLDVGDVKSIPLTESPGISWTPRSMIRKEFQFSGNGEILHYLLYTAETIDQGVRQKVSVSSYIISTQEGEPILTQLGRACSIEHHGIGDLHSTSIISAWTTDHVYLALPPLFCNSKILKLRLANFEANEDGLTVEFETLRNQIYFPSTAPERNPQLSVFTYEDQEELVLGLDAEVSETDASLDAEHSSLQPPTVMVWTLDSKADWRTWDAAVDAESAEYRSSQNSYQRLRGNYVDSDQRFTVPIRSGLNWRRKAFLSCS